MIDGISDYSKVDKLCECINEVRLRYKNKLNGCLHIAVAPEYFFAKFDANSPAPTTQTDKQSAVGKFKELTRAHEGLLLIPGTIFWSRSYDNPSLSKKTSHLKKVVEGSKFQATSPGTNADVKSTINDSMQSSANDLRASKKYNIVRNTCYIFFKDKVLVYHKYWRWDEYNLSMNVPVEAPSDMTDNSEPPPSIYAPGSNICTFNLGDLSFSLEICADRNSGRLDGIKNDIHIFMSGNYPRGIDKVTPEDRAKLLYVHNDSDTGFEVKITDRSAVAVDSIEAEYSVKHPGDKVESDPGQTRSRANVDVGSVLRIPLQDVYGSYFFDLTTRDINKILGGNLESKLKIKQP